MRIFTLIIMQRNHPPLTPSTKLCQSKLLSRAIDQKAALSYHFFNIPQMTCSLLLKPSFRSKGSKSFWYFIFIYFADSPSFSLWLSQWCGNFSMNHLSLCSRFTNIVIMSYIIFHKKTTTGHHISKTQVEFLFLV